MSSVSRDLPLKTSWTLYDHEKGTKTDYEKNTRMVGNFDNVIDFWSYFNSVPGPSSLFFQKETGKPYYMFNGKKREIASISLFRTGIEPRWEDPKNTNGSDLSLRKFYNKDMTPVVFLDNLWLFLSMACVGEQFTNSDTITGIRCIDSSIIASSKPLYRIELWFSDTKDITIRNKLEKEFINFLKLSTNDKLSYSEHNLNDI